MFFWPVEDAVCFYLIIFCVRLSSACVKMLAIFCALFMFESAFHSPSLFSLYVLPALAIAIVVAPIAAPMINPTAAPNMNVTMFYSFFNFSQASSLVRNTVFPSSLSEKVPVMFLSGFSINTIFCSSVSGM